MALVIPPFAFANSVDTMTGTPPATTPGVNFQTTTANADGSTVTLLSALAFDVHYLILGFSNTAIVNSDSSTLADILIDRAGGTSWTNFIDDLAVGFLIGQSSTNSWPGGYFHFPVYVPAGASLGVRARNNNGSLTTGRAIAYAYGNPNRPDQWWCGTTVETLGVVPTTSKGTDVTPGASGTYGTWTTIGTATSARWGAMQIAINGSDAAPSFGATFWQVGSNSTQLTGTQTMGAGLGSTGLGCTVMPGPIWCDIPESTTLQLRATFDNTATEIITASIYGVY